jgi:lipid A 3-O-deacylase
MHHYCITLAGIAAAVIAIPATALADDVAFDEIRLGMYKHDVSILGHQKEKGEDVGVEILFTSPAVLEKIASPRPIIGGLVNTAGQTDQLYTGLTWTWDFLQDVLTGGDGFYLEGTLGFGLHNGSLSVSEPADSQQDKSLGSRVLFREDVDIGYRFTPRWSLAISYNHISNANLANRNEGLNDFGVRVGFKF